MTVYYCNSVIIITLSLVRNCRSEYLHRAILLLNFDVVLRELINLIIYILSFDRHIHNDIMPAVPQYFILYCTPSYQ
jgi:hypothetical protein